MNREQAIEFLKGQGKDVSRLQKKVITNKTGKKQTVYVANKKDEPKEDGRAKKTEDEPNDSNKEQNHIGEGTISRGTKAYSKDGKEFTIKRDVPMKFTKKTEDGKMVFEHKGEEYTIDKKGIKDYNANEASSEEGEESTNEEQPEEVKERAENITSRLASKVKNFSSEQKKFFESGDFMHGSEFRSKVGDLVKSKAKGIYKAIKHEIHEIKDVGKGIKKLLPPPPYGKLTDHEKKAMKTFASHLALTVGTMLVTGGAGALVKKGMAKALSGVALHYLEHAGLMSVGKALAFAKAEDDEEEGTDKNHLTDEGLIMKVINDLADYLQNGDITDKDWISIFENQDDTVEGLQDIAGKEYSFEGKKEEKNDEQEEDDEDTGEDEKEVKKGKDMDTADFVYKDYMDKSFGKKREEMPQFDEDTLADVIVHFSNHAKISKVKKTLSAIKPTQDEINEDKILKKIKDKSDVYKNRRYIISLDGYLLDGHHDWAYGLEKDEDQEVDCYRISLPIANILKRANKLKIAMKKDINDKEIKK